MLGPSLLASLATTDVAMTICDRPAGFGLGLFGLSLRRRAERWSA